MTAERACLTKTDFPESAIGPPHGAAGPSDAMHCFRAVKCTPEHKEGRTVGSLLAVQSKANAAGGGLCNQRLRKS